MAFFDSLSYIGIVILLALFWRQHHEHMKSLHSLKTFVENGSSHNTNILNTSIERARELEINQERLSLQINAQFKDLESQVASLKTDLRKGKLKHKSKQSS